jgi:hypothetical protein
MVAPDKADRLLAVVSQHQFHDEGLISIATQIVEAVKACNADMNMVAEISSEVRKQLL